MESARLILDLGLILVAACGGAAAAQLLRQPLLVGYVVAGVVVGPFTPGLTVSDPHAFEQSAEIGVILLMFTIGMEVSFADLRRVGRLALVGGPLGIALVTGLAVAIGPLVGWGLAESIVTGAALSVASTMVLMKFLMERGELDAEHGRAIVGITLVEDFAVVVMTLIIPAFGPSHDGHAADVARGLVLATVALVPLVWLAGHTIPWLLERVDRFGNEELLLVATATIAVGTAAVTVALGLSHAIGAFLGGMAISGSKPAHRALDRLLPIRDLFVALFFVSVGMLVRPGALVAEWSAVAAMVAIVTLGKLAVWTGVVRAAGYSLQIATLAGLGLTQIGEFSYIVGKAAVDHGLIGRPLYDAILGTSLVTIVLNALTFRRFRRIA